METTKCSTVIGNSKIEFVTHSVGGIDEEILFRMTTKSYRAFRHFYDKDTNNRFATFELYARGNGWYAAYPINDVSNWGMRLRRMINHALTCIVFGVLTTVDFMISVNKMRADMDSKAPSVSGPRVVRRVLIGGKERVQAVSRAAQAMVARAHEKVSSPISAALVAQISAMKCAGSMPVTQSRLHDLQSHFAHA